MNETDIDDPSSDLACIGQYGTRAKAEEHGLVLLSLNFPYWLYHAENRYEIRVEPEFAPRLVDELDAYEEEMRDWDASPKGPPIPEYPSTVILPYLYGLLLCAAFIVQSRTPGLTDWGRNDAIRVFSSIELWRPFTALLLHADLGHLMGNVASGVIYGILTAKSLGPKTGWLLILLSGFLGNLLNAFIHLPDNHFSIGASTAVFGAIGILTGNGLVRFHHIRARSTTVLSVSRRLAPFSAGLVILGWWGMGGERTDVLAHVCGFVVGLSLGLIASRVRKISEQSAYTS